MNQDKIIHHATVLNFLEAAVKNNRLAHAYIFNGQEGIGKFMVAKRFASLLLCAKRVNAKATSFDSICHVCASCNQIAKDISPEVFVVKKDDAKKYISVDMARDLIQQLLTKSFDERFKIIIIDEAHNLNAGAANALLKTLEEPSIPVVMILVTSNINALPKTVISRTQVINFFPVPSDNIFRRLIELGIDRDRALILSRLAFGSPGKVLRYVTDSYLLNDYKGLITQLVDLVMAGLKDRFVIGATLLPHKAGSFNETGQALGRVLDSWLLVLRDVMLLQSNNNQAIVHVFVLDKLQTIASKFSIAHICKLMRKIEESKRDLKTNVLPQLIFENILVNF